MPRALSFARLMIVRFMVPAEYSALRAPSGRAAGVVRKRSNGLEPGAHGGVGREVLQRFGQAIGPVRLGDRARRVDALARCRGFPGGSARVSAEPARSSRPSSARLRPAASTVAIGAGQGRELPAVGRRKVLPPRGDRLRVVGAERRHAERQGSSEDRESPAGRPSPTESRDSRGYRARPGSSARTGESGRGPRRPREQRRPPRPAWCAERACLDPAEPTRHRARSGPRHQAA